MTLKNIVSQINVFNQCRRYGLPLWQCPSFLFLIMGFVIIVSIILAYIIGTRYIEDPVIVTLIILGLATILFIMAFTITNSFEKLAEVSRMKSEFISVVSHQLRSPLTNLKWAIDLIMSGELGKIEEQQVEYFKILKENNERMMELVEDLLYVSRIETATLSQRKSEISLVDLIEKMILRFEPFAKASNIKINFNFEKNLPLAFVDPDQMKQVVENLLDNAIRYIKRGGKIDISLSKRNSFFYFEIKDNGIGIPQEDQKYIFQKFFRSKNVLKYQTQGSGLGLFIVKSIIERSGGKVGFKSQEGQGTTFWFTLPITNNNKV
jgi:signal transduction histidine kinase